MTDAIVTVHGTFAGSDRSEGDKWWQHGSAFARDLETYWPRPFEIHPFRWSGANTELERRRAGRRLRRELSALAQRYDKVFVVGHSHGGNVIAAAIGSDSLISNGIRGDADDFVFLTVGTPFLTTERANAKAMLEVISITFLFGAMLALILNQQAIAAIFKASWLAFIFEQLPSSSHEIVAGLIAICLGTVALAILVLAGLLGAVLYGRPWLAQANPSYVFSKRLVAIYDRDDEAIALLQRGLRASTPVTPHRAATATVVFPILYAMLVAYIGYTLYQVIDYDSVREGFAMARAAHQKIWLDMLATYGASPQSASVTEPVLWYALITLIALMDVLVFAIFFTQVNKVALAPLMRSLASLSGAMLAPVLGPRLARRLDDVFWQTARSNLFGVDPTRIMVKKVWTNRSWPPWRPLGEAVHRELVAACDASVKATWSALRSRLRNDRPTRPVWFDGRGSAGNDSFDWPGLTSRLSWQELIHNAYFESAIVRRLMILALLLRNGEDVPAALRSDPALAALLSAYQEILPDADAEIEDALNSQYESPAIRKLLKDVVQRERWMEDVHGWHFRHSGRGGSKRGSR